MCHVSTQGIDERMINVHYYYKCTLLLLYIIETLNVFTFEKSEPVIICFLLNKVHHQLR